MIMIAYANFIVHSKAKRSFALSNIYIIINIVPEYKHITINLLLPEVDNDYLSAFVWVCSGMSPAMNIVFCRTSIDKGRPTNCFDYLSNRRGGKAFLFFCPFLS